MQLIFNVKGVYLKLRHNFAINFLCKRLHRGADFKSTNRNKFLNAPRTYKKLSLTIKYTPYVL